MKILYVTTISNTMSFFEEHFKMLIGQGNKIELACNTTTPVRKHILDLGIKVHNISFSRSPITKDNLKAYRELEKLIRGGHYDIVHCHTPNAAVITRLVCKKYRKKENLKVFYTAHGFHFYKGAPIKNWLLYYSIEWICSHWTDVLITINQEDYIFAQKYMYAKNIEYVPGVGLNTEKFKKTNVDRKKKRKEIGINDNNIMLLSVGELNANKNHQIIIRAIAKLKNSNIHYAIAGVGNKYDELYDLSKKLGVSEQLHLLGYRDDVEELYSVADICCFPSIREGLGMAALEGMAMNLPLVAANNRGTRDFCHNGQNGFLCDPEDDNQFALAIKKLIEDKQLCKKIGDNNRIRAIQFNTQIVLQKMNRIYNENVLKRI